MSDNLPLGVLLSEIQSAFTQFASLFPEAVRRIARDYGVALDDPNDIRIGLNTPTDGTGFITLNVKYGPNVPNQARLQLDPWISGHIRAPDGSGCYHDEDSFCSSPPNGCEIGGGPKTMLGILIECNIRLEQMARASAPATTGPHEGYDSAVSAILAAILNSGRPTSLPSRRKPLSPRR